MSASPTEHTKASQRYARALALLQSGQAKRAAELLQPLAEANPKSGPLWVNLAGAWVEAGEASSALAASAHACELLPQDADAWTNRGLAERLAGRSLDAAASFERAIARDPQHANAWLQLAECYETVGDLDGAMAILDDQLAHWRRQPDGERASEAAVFVHLMRIAAGRVLLQQRRARPAHRMLAEALAADPDSAEACNLTGVALRQLGRPTEAVGFYQRAIALDPTYAAAMLNLSHVARQLGRLSLAEKSARSALHHRPRWAAAGNALSSALRGQGRIEQAADVMRASLGPNPSLRMLSNALSLEHYRDGQTAAALQLLHRQWEQTYLNRHGEPERGFFPNARPRGKRLRLGFLSPDLGRHPVGFFLAGLLPHLRAVGLEAYCYSDRGFEDEVTTRLKRDASQWRNVVSETDAQLARIIRRDRVDILVDLAGHTEGHRLELFAERAAPLQVSWIGYVGATGVPNMDAVIADAVHIPPGDETHYDEQVVRLPHGYVCYEPPVDLPPILPRSDDQPTVFGAFHNPAKISPATIAAWADVLRGVPDSTLRLTYWGMRSRGTMEQIGGQFAECGVERERLDFQPSSGHRDLLASYADIAVLLDPLAYSGGLTTVEAIAMGVPVITRPGDTFASRHAASHLTAIGRERWICRSTEEYVATAVALASDRDELSRQRLTLRGALASSPLCDHAAFASHLADALQALWDERFAAAGDDLRSKFVA